MANRENPTCLFSPQALWKISSSTLIYIHETDEARIRSIYEFSCVRSHTCARTPMFGKPTVITEKSFPRAAPSVDAAAQVLERKFWVGVSAFVENQSQHATHVAARRLAFYIFQIMFSFFLEKTWIFICCEICLKKLKRTQFGGWEIQLQKLGNNVEKILGWGIKRRLTIKIT